ncbi:MAG: hypothetical protein JWP85_1077 [Rhodoglobus sp.]|nr:hypothetical protein [Rhodoglobus sp.]
MVPVRSNATSVRFGPDGPVPVSDDSAERWVLKARQLARPLLDLAGGIADPSPVVPHVVHDSDQWAFGNFMLAWLDSAGPQRRVRHLPDASFFLRLLGRAYAPVFERRPDLAELLLDDSRLEMSLTNDVLQIQLRVPAPGAAYSMIRNHALMLFVAALWLDQPRRDQWLDLYDELVSYVDERPEGRPGLAELVEIEAGAFADFVEFAPLTLRAAATESVIRSDGLLDRILEYQLCAGVAIGLLWRDYRAVPDADREAWFREQLSELYARPDYLNEKWTENR